MGKLFDFTRLIDKYSNDITISIPTEGDYVNGTYQPGEPTIITVKGAIFPLSEQKIYRSGGSLTQADRQLVMKAQIEGALKGATVKKGDETYKVEDETPYSDFADMYSYTLKRVSNFDRLPVFTVSDN